MEDQSSEFNVDLSALPCFATCTDAGLFMSFNLVCLDMKKILICSLLSFPCLSQSLFAAQSVAHLGGDWHYELNMTTQPKDGDRINEVFVDRNKNKGKAIADCDFRLRIPQKMIDQSDRVRQWIGKDADSIKVTYDTETCTMLH